MTLNSSPKGNINRTLKHKSSIDFKNWGEEQRTLLQPQKTFNIGISLQPKKKRSIQMQ